MHIHTHTHAYTHTYIHIYIYMYTYICMYVFMYIYHIHIYTGLKIGGFASPNAIHFWGKCESFGQLIRNIFGSLRISLG